MEMLGSALRDAKEELETLRACSAAGVEYDVRAFEVTLKRFVHCSSTSPEAGVSLSNVRAGTDSRRSTRCWDLPLAPTVDTAPAAPWGWAGSLQISRLGRHGRWRGCWMA